MTTSWMKTGKGMGFRIGGGGSRFWPYQAYLGRLDIVQKREGPGVAPQLVYTNGTPIRANGGEQPRDIIRVNTLFCRCF
jgi:hypothetical protein